MRTSHMALLPYILFSFSVLITNSFAQAIVQEEKVEIAALGIERYVKIIPKINTSLLIPGYEYEIPLEIAWDVPSSALVQIKSPRVDIFVELESKNISQAYFRQNQTISNIYRTILQCHITNGACGNLSRLTEDVRVYIKIAYLGTQLSEYVIVRAAPLPFGEFSEIVEEQRLLSAELDSLRQNTTKMIVSENATYLNETQRQAIEELEKMINETDAKIIQFRLAEAKRDIDEINALLGKLSAQYSFLMKISYLENLLLELLKENLTAQEREIYDEIILTLTKAKEEAFSFEFASANNSIAEAENRTAMLKDTIAERKRLGLADISTLFGINVKNIGFDLQTLTVAFVFIIMAIIVFLILKLGKKQRLPGSRR